MEPREFKFKFMVMTVTATLDDTYLTVKQGVRKWKVEVARLKYLYVIDHDNVGHECILAHEAGPNQLKRVRFNASFGQQSFDEFIQAVLARRPEIDIREKPLDEAHKLMGAPNFVKWAPLIAVVLVVGAVAVFFIPAILHGLDSGQQTIDAAQCAAECDVATSNLTVRGTLLLDAAIQKETTREGSSVKTVQVYVPLVPRDWKAGDPIYLVVETPDMSNAEFDELAALDAVPAVLRDTLWEGLGSDEAEFFEKDVGLKLADEVRLLEYRAKPERDLYLGLGAIGLTLLIMVIVAIVIARKGGASRAAGKKA